MFELGRGGMGRVYLGRVVGAGGFERMVAIKRTNPELSHGELSERFMNEARMAAYVHHANVVGTHQAGRDEQGHYLVCDYVEGESLAGLMARARRSGKVPAPIVARIVSDGLAGLHAAHEAMDPAGTPLHMLHRDVSTDNLLVGRDGVTRLSDFGIAKSVLSPMLTEEGLRHGKLIYFPPEYLRSGPVDRTLDIYAMGVTLWAGLAGYEPWETKEEAQILHTILTEGLPRLGVHAPELPPAFEAVIQRACQRDPAQRYQTARQMSVALEQLEQRGAVRIASHVQVAEYVEAAIGAELAARRERVRVRRIELAAQLGDDAYVRREPSSSPVDTSDTSVDRIRADVSPDSAEAGATTGAAASLELPSLALPATSHSARHGSLRWLGFGAALACALALAYVVLRPHTLTPAPQNAPVQKAPRTPHADIALLPTQPEVSAMADRPSEDVDGSVLKPAEATREASAGAPLTPPKPTVTPLPSRKRKVLADEPPKREKSPSQGDDDPSPPGISTRNPYR